MKINSIPIDARPREKGLKYGLDTLNDDDLLAIFLGSGTRECNAIELARTVLDSYQCSIRDLGNASIDDLKQIKGIGTCKALVIESLGEWARRYSSSPISLKVQIETSFEVYKHFYEKVSNQKQEQLIVLLLDSKKRLLGEEMVAKGGINEAVVSIGEIFKPAIKRGGVGIILIHNHPSGDPTPSQEDLQLTERLKKGGDLLGIKLIDHLIIGLKCYYSFANGRIFKEST